MTIALFSLETREVYGHISRRKLIICRYIFLCWTLWLCVLPCSSPHVDHVVLVVGYPWTMLWNAHPGVCLPQVIRKARRDTILPHYVLDQQAASEN